MQQNEENNINWVPAEKVCELLHICLKTLKSKCLANEFTYKIVKNGRKANYFINSSSLPKVYQDRIINNSEIFIGEEYSNAPIWAKAQADKYIHIIKDTEKLKGKALKNYIKSWNTTNPEKKTSYSSLMYMKQRYEESGLSGLLARYGRTNNRAIIKDEYYEYFKNLYLVEGGPSIQSCWDNTLGYAMRTTGINRVNFPSKFAFIRKLQREISKDSIFLARNGQSSWNRKYGKFIDRDYSGIVCGKVWVSDHAQLDIACITNDGNIVFPWITSWRDYKSGKWLGWLLQTGHPNSDLIFQTFYYAASKYGLPDDVIIDNGKDYRSKDFAGGRKFKIEANKGKTTSMLSELNVDVHFALPYNAQTKPIERDFLKIKGLLSKHCLGYRGGNVVERPEKLADEIKNGKIIPFESLKAIFDDFIINILNKRPSQGKNLKGLSPDNLFNREFEEKTLPSKDALKLFCMRTSKTYTIGRNGITDRQLDITYYADWLIHKTGLKIYMRRDVENYKEAWVFKADNDEFIGKVTAVKAIPALHAEKISKEEFKEAMATKKRHLKVAKAYIKQTREISIEEKCENYKAAYASVEKEAKPKVSKMANTNMDKAVRKAKEMEAFGKQDLSIFMDSNEEEKTHLYLFETDKSFEEQEKGVAYGS